MGFLPKNRFDSSRIVPTEFDYYFRSQLLQGDVHDMGAAMLGGVGGHAGLFSNANDLGIFMQMLFKMDNMVVNAISKTILLINLLNVSFVRMKTEEVLVLIKPILEGQEGGPACDCSPSSKSLWTQWLYRYFSMG